MSRSAPAWSKMTRLSASDETAKAIRLGMFALMTPVITSTLGRCVARTGGCHRTSHLGDAHH